MIPRYLLLAASLSFAGCVTSPPPASTGFPVTYTAEPADLPDGASFSDAGFQSARNTLIDILAESGVTGSVGAWRDGAHATVPGPYDFAIDEGPVHHNRRVLRVWCLASATSRALFLRLVDADLVRDDDWHVVLEIASVGQLTFGPDGVVATGEALAEVTDDTALETALTPLRARASQALAARKAFRDALGAAARKADPRPGRAVVFAQEEEAIWIALSLDRGEVHLRPASHASDYCKLLPDGTVLEGREVAPRAGELALMRFELPYLAAIRRVLVGHADTAVSHAVADIRTLPRLAHVPDPRARAD